MKRAGRVAVAVVVLTSACTRAADVSLAEPTEIATTDVGLDLADFDLSVDGLRNVDLHDAALEQTTWDEVVWADVDIESLVTALGLTLDDLGERPGLDQLIASYGDFLGLDQDLGTGEEDIAVWIVSTQLDALARDLDVDGFDRLRAGRDEWPMLVADPSAAFVRRMEELGLVSLHLRQAMMIEASRDG